MARAGVFRLILSDAILDEVAEVLERKFDWPSVDLAVAKRQLERFGHKIKPVVTLDVVKDDPDDNRILECAVSAVSDYIITGDKDLLRLGRYDGIKIINVSEFLNSVKFRVRDV